MNTPLPAIDGAIVEIAPAKVNLALHVTGQRTDGYHLLDSIVTFADTGDRLAFSRASKDGFDLVGAFAPLLAGDTENGNLVLKARDLLRVALEADGQPAPPVMITLEKNLPVAAGIGGGSADAAATLRGLMRIWEAEMSVDQLSAIALTLGADVPMCLSSCPARVTGIGETLEPLGVMPVFAMVLANPLRPVSTPAIFKLLERKDNDPANTPPESADEEAWIDWLSGLRNDLEPPATQLLSEIGEVSSLLRDMGARLVRMSGSGATCFGLFGDFAAAQAAAHRLSHDKPSWYIVATKTIAGETA